MKNLEHIIFACIFYNHELFIQIEKNIFFNDIYNFYECLKDMYDKQYVISISLFKRCFNGQSKWKANIEKIDDILKVLENEDDNFNYYLSEYLKLYNSRKVVEVFNRFKNDKIENNDLLKEIQNVLVERQDAIKITTMYDIITHPDFEKPISTIKIGREFFDKYENGFRNGELILIAARPSVGKSSEMKHIALQVLIYEQKKVGIFSAEMNGNRIAKDSLSMLAEVSKRDYAAGKLDQEKEWAIQTAKEFILEKSKNYWIDDTPNIEISRLIRMSKEMKKWGAEIIFIDYVQLIRTYGMEKKDRRLQIDYISKNLKQLARDLYIPIVLLTQVTRLQDGKIHPSKSDLKESGSLEEDADVVIILSVEEWIDEEHFTRCIVRNNVDKNRNGATGIYYTDFNRVIGFMKDIKYNKEST
jgi:replicative DNA helicase